MLTPRKGLPAGITHRQMYLRMTKETQYVNDARRDSVRFAVYDIPAPCNVPKRQEFARWHVCVFFVRNKKKTRDGRRSDSLRLMATAATITVLRPGDSTPGDFARSVFVVCAPSEEGDFLKLLGTAIAGTDGASVIFMSGDAGESEDERWRSEALEVSDAILCWLSAAGGAPEARRRFTRLVSQYGSSGKLFVGHPASEDAWAGPVEKCEGVSAARDPKALVAQANRQFSKGASRQGPERKVPQMIWHTPAWKKWYDALLSVGNRLVGIKVEWILRVGPGGVYVLFWAVLANIWVAVERRHKSNEVVIARPDIACVLAFLPGADMLDTEIILVQRVPRPLPQRERVCARAPWRLVVQSPHRRAAAGSRRAASGDGHQGGKEPPAPARLLRVGSSCVSAATPIGSPSFGPLQLSVPSETSIFSLWYCVCHDAALSPRSLSASFSAS